jgi:hypothetical protein
VGNNSGWQLTKRRAQLLQRIALATHMSCCVSAMLLVTQYTVRTLLDATKSAASSRCVRSTGMTVAT